MKKDTVYHILVIFIIYLAFKKIFDIFIDFEYPTYSPPPVGIWRDLVYIRQVSSFITAIFCIILLVLLYNISNLYITVVIAVYLLHEIAYILFDEGYIWYIINKSHHSEIVAAVFDKYLNSSVNLLLGLYCFYAIVYIFYK